MTNRRSITVAGHRGRHGERGLAMLTLVAAVTLVTMISLSLIGLMYADMTHASIQYAVTRSFYVAQAGLAEARARVSRAADPAAYATPKDGVTVPFGGGQFTYWVDAGPATGCGPGFKTLEAVGQVTYRGRAFPRRVRACAAPGSPLLAALFGVSRVQFQGAGSRTYLAPRESGTPGGGASVGSFIEINFSDNDVRVNALSEASNEMLTLRDGTFFDYALFGFSKRPDYAPDPTADPAPWILSVFGDIVKAQAANRQLPTPCGSPYACVTVGNNITDVQGAGDLRKSMYLRHVYVRSLRKEIAPPLELDPGTFRTLAGQNTANATLNSAAGIPGKDDSVYTSREFTRLLLHLRRHPAQFLQGTVYVDGSLTLVRPTSLGGNAGNVTLAVRGDLVIRSTAIVTNRHDLSTAAGRQAPGILVFGAPTPTSLARKVCGVEINGSGRLIVCRGGGLIADGLIYTQDGMAMKPKSFVDQVGAMYHNNRGTSNPSFVNDDATVVLRFDPLALSALGTGLSILSWQQLHGPDQTAPAPPPPAIALSPSAPATAAPQVGQQPPAPVSAPAASVSPPTGPPSPPAASVSPPPGRTSSPPAVPRPTEPGSPPRAVPSPTGPASPAAAVPPPAAPAVPPAVVSPSPGPSSPPAGGSPVKQPPLQPSNAPPAGGRASTPAAAHLSPVQESARQTVETRPTPPAPVSGGTPQAGTPPTPSVSTAGSPVFHVQAGAFKNREYADDLVRRLKARGYSVTVVEASLIRVWVGSPMSRPAAEALAATLGRDGFEAFLTLAR